MPYKARSISTIEQAILADKEAKAPLAGLTSTSQTSVWRALISIFSTATNLHEQSFEEYAREIEDRALEIPAGTLYWYASESKKFQYGDSLSLVEGAVTYSVIDESKQIVDFSAASYESGYVVIKVAKSDGEGLATPLGVAELDALISYWNQKKFAQAAVVVVSVNGDEAIINYRIGVNNLLINPATGQRTAGDGVYPVEDAITSYMQGFQGEFFNSKLSILGLTDAIQSVNGVLNAVPVSVQIRPYNGVLNEVLDNINQEYNTFAGWSRIDPLNPLRNTLTYYNG